MFKLLHHQMVAKDKAYYLEEVQNINFVHGTRIHNKFF